MPSKDRKKKVGKKSEEDAQKPVLAVRANCNASDEASVIMDPINATTEQGGGKSVSDDNVIMKLTFGANAGMAPDAYQSYHTDILSTTPESMDCFNLSTVYGGQDQLFASDPNSCSLAPIQEWPGYQMSVSSQMSQQMPLPPHQVGSSPLEAPVAMFGSMAAPADASLWNSASGLNAGTSSGAISKSNRTVQSKISSIPISQGINSIGIHNPSSSISTSAVGNVGCVGGVGVKVVRLLAEFEEKGKTGEWPLSTSVHCYWCSHQFKTPPVGLPIRYINQTGKFQTIGCFCSLQCACAYNFDSTRDSDEECMARYSLLNALSNKLGCGRIIKPAPSRLALSMFGGHMSIDDFRSYGAGRTGTTNIGGPVQRQIIINCPPMQSVTQQVEDISESDMTSEYRYVPLDNDRVQRYQEKVRLQRTKPLSDMKNTLDRTMKLKYNEPARV